MNGGLSTLRNKTQSWKEMEDGTCCSAVVLCLCVCIHVCMYACTYDCRVLYQRQQRRTLGVILCCFSLYCLVTGALTEWEAPVLGSACLRPAMLGLQAPAAMRGCPVVLGLEVRASCLQGKCSNLLRHLLIPILYFF